MKFNWNNNVYIFKYDIEKIELDDVNIYGYGFSSFYSEGININEIKIDNQKNNILIMHADLDASKEAKELYDKLESLLHEKHNEATYESPLVGSFVSSCSFQSNKGIITLIIIEQDYDYQVKMSYTDTASLSNRINLKLNATDTVSLSNRINLKVNTADSSIAGGYYPYSTNPKNYLTVYDSISILKIKIRKSIIS